MIHQRLLLALNLLLQSTLSPYFQFDCDQNFGNYTNTPTYAADLNATLSFLSTNINSTGFSAASAGEVNAVALCRGDLQVTTCRDCVRDAAAQLVESCPDQKQAVLWDTPCMVRYTNATVAGVRSTSPSRYLRTTQNASSPAQFMADLRGLMDDLRRKAAAGSSLRKVAAGNTTGPDFQTIFGLVQCTPDLSSEDCASCLVGAISEIPFCCDGRRGGRVRKPSCNLRFESEPFFNETRLQELEQSPAPVSEPPPQSSPEVARYDLSKCTAIEILWTWLDVGVGPFNIFICSSHLAAKSLIVLGNCIKEFGPCNFHADCR